jgi:hypothetical protein
MERNGVKACRLHGAGAPSRRCYSRGSVSAAHDMITDA